ncbi:MAG: hypothetical protein V3T64_14845 [Myxococcota bacterium]
MSTTDSLRTFSSQDRIEKHTLELLREPRIELAKREGEQTLLAAIPDPDPENQARFAEVATEITLNALMGMVDGRSGEDLPRLIQRPPHEIDGERVPGNRGLHDNPDTFYRLIPMDGVSDFILEGEVDGVPATIFELSLLTSQWETIGHLSKQQLGLGSGKRFRIHVGLEPGPSVDHFLQSAADAEMLLLRETLADWSREAPCQLSIENRVSRGGPREKDDSAFIEAAAQRVEKWFRESARLTKAPLEQPANFFSEPVIRNEHGMLVTMAYSVGHFHVPPGQALVVTLDPGSATYVVAPITNLWGTTGDGLARGASWNSSQAALNDDGSFTCVVSLEDPGVHNWLDPEGLERGFLFLRWAGLPPDGPPLHAPGLRTRVVATGELRKELPPQTVWVDSARRRAIQDARERDHAPRYDVLSTKSSPTADQT